MDAKISCIPMHLFVMLDIRLPEVISCDAMTFYVQIQNAFGVHTAQESAFTCTAEQLVSQTGA